MKRLLVLAALSLAGFVETAPQASAWWPCLGCGHSSCCDTCKVKVCCQPYNAFSCCPQVNVFGNFCGVAGCGQNGCGPRWGCGAGCNQPWSATYSSWATGGCCDAPAQPFCMAPPMPFGMPASCGAACGDTGCKKEGHKFFSRLRRRVDVEPSPCCDNSCNPTFTADACGDCEQGHHHRHHRQSWWARFSRQQLCCPANSCGVMEYTCNGCGNASAPAAAPSRVEPVPAPKSMPKGASTANPSSTPDLSSNLSILQDPFASQN